ncbi:MAG: hypothetical protein ACRBBU_07760, partial [Pseudooceanicola sp.]
APKVIGAGMAIHHEIIAAFAIIAKAGRLFAFWHGTSVLSMGAVKTGWDVPSGSVNGTGGIEPCAAGTTILDTLRHLRQSGRTGDVSSHSPGS